MHGQGCREFFEWPVTLSLTKEVEPKGCQAPFIEEMGQGLVGCTVLAGEKSMAQHGETRRWYVRRTQYRSDAVTVRIMKGQSFFSYAAQWENTPAGCSKGPSSKAAGDSKPEAYPRGYVEDFDEPRTKLADFFSILLGLEKMKRKDHL